MNFDLGVSAGINIPWLDIIGLLLFMLGYTIGLGSGMGAAIGIFLSTECEHWIQRIVRPHKAAEPFIWIGLVIAVIGAVILYRDSGLSGVASWQMIVLLVLIANNFFLRYSAVPRFVGALEAPPAIGWQVKVIVSVIVSIFCWTAELFLMIWWLLVV